MSNRTTEYLAQVASHYPQEIADQVMNLRPTMSEGGVPYVHIKAPEPTHDGLFMFVPGLGEGIVNKISFAAEMARQGADMILPGQYRGTARNEDGTRMDVLVDHADKYQGVMDETGATTPIGHSYGAQITEQMVRDNPELFTDKNVVLLAPSGSIPDQTSLDISVQWLRMVRSEASRKRPMKIADANGVTGQASISELSKNPLLTLREMQSLRDREIDYDNLAHSVGRLVVVTYAEDYMFPNDLVDLRLGKAVEAGATWLMPYDSDGFASSALRYGGEGAVHDDEQYNPKRVVSALLDALG